MGPRRAPSRTGERATTAEVVAALWHMARPPIWVVSLLPLWVGHLLATRTLLPGFDRWTAFWAGASGTGADAHDFWATCRLAVDDAAPLLLAAFVFGPAAWAAALLINDVHDLAGDRRNPRKQDTPLVRGAASPAFARRAAYGFGMVALIGAATLSVAFCAVTATFLVLAWAYSVPPLRLKSRPGADVLVNAVGVGTLPLLAGWTVTRSLASFPWAMLAQGFLVAVALYVPTTLVDHAADAAAGYRTLATRLGPRAAYELGVAAWIAANAGAVLLAALNVVLPREMLPVLVLAAPALVAAYHLLIGRARGPAQMIRGIVLVSGLFLVPNAIFALMYTGLWVPGR